VAKKYGIAPVNLVKVDNTSWRVMRQTVFFYGGYPVSGVRVNGIDSQKGEKNDLCLGWRGEPELP